MLSLVLLVALASTPGLSPAPFGNPQIAGFITDSGMAELSGLAPSQRRQDRLWGINDSGQPAYLWALDLKGKVLGGFELRGVRNIDFEDLASFRWKNKSYLAIADIGDNGGLRDSLVIYIVREPKKLGGDQAPAWSVRFRYPDGVFDDESLAVDVAQQRMFVVSKRTDPPVLYSVPLRPKTGELQVATRLGEFGHLPGTDPDSADPSNQVRFATQPTGLAIGCDGRELLLLTYASVYRYTRSAQQDWPEALIGQKPQILALPPLTQAEAISLDRNCKSLYVGSENVPSPLIRFIRNKP